MAATKTCIAQLLAGKSYTAETVDSLGNVVQSGMACTESGSVAGQFSFQVTNAVQTATYKTVFTGPGSFYTFYDLSETTATFQEQNSPTAGMIAADIAGGVPVTNSIVITPAQAAASFTPGTLPIKRGDFNSFNLTLGNITGRTKLVLTCKRKSQVENSSKNTDAFAVFQMQEGVGLTVFNPVPVKTPVTPTAAHGSLTVNDQATGDVTWTMNQAEAAQLQLEDLIYDVQWWDASGKTHTPAGGSVVIDLDVTQSVV